MNNEFYDGGELYRWNRIERGKESEKRECSGHSLRPSNRSYSNFKKKPNSKSQEFDWANLLVTKAESK